MSNVAKNFDI